ncbi:MAG TPA: DegT/DnrJ/EryC1/StrS family aminotransferase [Dehalococcoidia bacterium]|nr:DegT/DnrJ/EryC1/StrS family aminotransferase [Dehalococcoidia bacterium]
MKVPPAAIHFPDEDRAWIMAQIDECLRSGQLTLGRHGAALEAAFAEACEARHAIAVNSGTSALEIILRAIGVAGREVIVPTNTFYASAGAVVHAGGTPVFADCEPQSFALDPGGLAGLISPRTAAVMVVHIGGLISPRLPEIQQICQRAGVPLIEDAAHAHGSRLAGRPAGSFGVAAAFSFYPTKVITSGEGGVIVTNDESIDREARIYRDQGKEGFSTNFHVRMGYNWRLSEPHAVIGLAQFRRLREFAEHRQAIAQVYDRQLAGLAPAIVPVQPATQSESNYYKYIALLDGVERAPLKRMLREEFDIGLSGEVYETPCHRQPVFADGECHLPQADDLCARHICLPISAVMREADAEYVVESLAASLERLQLQKERA